LAGDQQAVTKAAASAAAEGKYNESWDAASSLLQNAVDKEQFAQTLAGVRKPLGKLLSRDLKSARYSTSLPGASNGYELDSCR